MFDRLFNKHFGETVVFGDLNEKTRAYLQREIKYHKLNIGKGILVRFDDCTVGVSIICTMKEFDGQYEYIIREKSKCHSIRDWAEKHTGLKWEDVAKKQVVRALKKHK